MLYYFILEIIKNFNKLEIVVNSLANVIGSIASFFTAIFAAVGLYFIKKTYKLQETEMKAIGERLSLDQYLKLVDNVIDKCNELNFNYEYQGGQLQGISRGAEKGLKSAEGFINTLTRIHTGYKQSFNDNATQIGFLKSLKDKISGYNNPELMRQVLYSKLAVHQRGIYPLIGSFELLINFINDSYTEIKDQKINELRFLIPIEFQVLITLYLKYSLSKDYIYLTSHKQMILNAFSKFDWFSEA